MRLSTLNPVSMFFGPIFQKEMRTAGRKRGTYIVRALYAAGLLALVCVAFVGIRSSTAMMSGVQRVQQLQQLAPQMALFLVWFQFIGLMLAAPILAAPSVCDEKRARTLSALMTTPLNAAQIVFGKLTSRLVMLAILALLVAPLLLAIRVFGGLDGRVVIATTAISLSTAFLGAALGLMYSTWHKRASNAAVFGLLTLVLLQAAPSAIEGVIYYVVNTRDAVAAGRKPEYKYHQDVFATCAPATMTMISERAVMGGDLPEIELTWLPHRQEQIGATLRPVPLVAPTWALNTGYNILVGLLVTLYSTVMLRRIMLVDATTEGGASAALTRRERKKLARAAAGGSAAPVESPGGEAEPGPEIAMEAMEPAPEIIEESRRTREVSDRPVLWREVRQPLFGSRLRLIIVSVLACVGLAFTYYWAGTSEGPFSFRVAFANEGLHGALSVIGAIAVMLQPVFMTAGAIANEREARTWEVLLTTPLPARSIMLGKLIGTLRTQWFIPAIVLLHFVLSAALGYVSPLLPLHLFLIYLGPTLLFSSTGLLFSLLFKRGVIAAVSNLLAALALWAGSWIGIGLIGWFLEFEDDQVLSLASNGAYCLNPVAFTVSAVESAVRLGRVGAFHTNYEIYGVNSHTVGAGVFTLVVFGVFAFYAVVAVGAVSWAVALFPRFSGRAWAADHTPEEGFAAASRIISAALFVALVGLIGLALARIPGLIVGVGGSLLLAGGTIIRSRHRPKPTTPESPPAASA